MDMSQVMVSADIPHFADILWHLALKVQILNDICQTSATTAWHDKPHKERTPLHVDRTDSLATT